MVAIPIKVVEDLVPMRLPLIRQETKAISNEEKTAIDPASLFDKSRVTNQTYQTRLLGSLEGGSVIGSVVLQSEEHN